MPKYRARVSITLPFKQRYSSISVSSEAELEGEDLEALRDEVQKFVLGDVESLLHKAYDRDPNTHSHSTGKTGGPHRVKKGRP